MKINLAILIAVILIPVLLAGWIQQKPPAGINAMVLPAFSLLDRTGKHHASGDFSGKIVMVNFWASWCAPCVVEFPHFLKLAADHRNDVVLLALSSDHDTAAMERFLKKHAFKTTPNVVIAHDADGAITRDLFKTYKLPETFIFDRDGILIHKITGADWTPADIEKYMD